MSEATEAMLNRVMGLLNKADSTEFPAEADALRAKAQELMQRYRIEEEQLIAQDPIAVVPIWAMVEVAPAGSDFRQSYIELFYAACVHAGVKVHFGWERNPQRVVGHIVGYDGDVRLVQWIYAASRAVFQEKLDPRIDRKLPDADNIYRLRSAGLTRREVAIQLWDLDTHAAHATVGRVYKEESHKRGEAPKLDGRGISAAQFRSSYAENFVDELHRCLRRARDGADSVGGAVTLHGRKERIQEAYWERYPTERPVPAVVLTEEQKEAAAELAKKAPKPRKRSAVQIAAAQRRIERKYYSPAALAGRSAGVAAAKTVQLDRASDAQRLPSDQTGKAVSQ